MQVNAPADQSPESLVTNCELLTDTIHTSPTNPNPAAVVNASVPRLEATGYLRIAADRHYFTDVIAAAAAGSAIGVTMPLFLHAPRRSAHLAVTVLPMDGGLFANVGGAL